MALFYLGLFCWASNRISSGHFPEPRYESTSEKQSRIADSQVRKFRFELLQNASGVRTLQGDLLESSKMTPFVAPAENNTMVLLAEKGINYETKIENRDTPRLSMPPAGGLFVAADSILLVHPRGRRRYFGAPKP